MKIPLTKGVSKSLKDEKYYPQFPERFRNEAAQMAAHYEVFYCLENAIRDLIRERLEETGADWWNQKVPQQVRTNAETNQKKEVQAGVTPRSVDMMSYTNFGELGEIIKTNWDLFGDTFKDVSAVQNVIAGLNRLRAPIAHCAPPAEDEIVRLRLSMRDWFRQME